MDDSSPRVTDDVPETLRQYDERLRALEQAVAELKAGRPAVAQAAAQSQHSTEAGAQIAPDHPYQTAQGDADTVNPQTTTVTAPVAGGERRPETRVQTQQKPKEEEQEGGVPIFGPLVIGAIAWFISGYFMVGAGVALVACIATYFFGSSRKGAAKNADGSPTADTANGGDQTKAVPRGPRAPRIKTDLEQSIGRYWYLWTGVALLVVGLGYGLMLAYEHVGPVVKIASWFAGAVALVVAGEFAHRRMSFKPFGLALVAGGYAVGYFTIYAMQNIASVKLIDNVVLDSCLLLAMAAGCMLHSLYRRSETVALLSALLAFVTLSLSAVTAFTVVASAVMALGLALVIVRMRWFIVYLVGVIGSYATFVLFTQPQITGSVEGVEGLLLSGAFLAAHWLVYSLVHFWVRQPEESDATRRFTVTASLLNAGGFITLNLLALGAEFADWRYLFLLFVGAAYGTFAYLARKRSMAFSGTLFTLISLGAATAAVPLWLSPNAVTAVWLLEVPVLVIAGLRFRMIELRGFAVAVAVLSAARLFSGDLFGVTFQLVSGLTAVVAFMVSHLAYRVKAFEGAQHKIEQELGRFFYLGAAAVVAWWMPLALSGASMQAFWWATAGIAFFGYAFVMRDRVGEYIAAAMLATSGGALVINYASVSTVVTVLNLAIFFAGSAIYRWRGVKPLLPTDADAQSQVLNITLHHTYSVAAVAITWALTALNMGDSNQLALWLAVESALVVAAGFWLKDAVVRQLGSLGMLGSGAALFLSVNAWTWPITLPVVAGLYALTFAYRLLPAANGARPQSLLDTLVLSSLGDREADVVKLVSAVAGTVLATVACYNLLAWQWLAVAWSLEAIVLLTVGVKLNDKVFRYSAHAVFALMLAKLVFWDLRGAEQYVRVIIFIVAGIVSIAAAFIFARFEKKLGEEKNAAENPRQEK